MLAAASVYTIIFLDSQISENFAGLRQNLVFRGRILANLGFNHKTPGLRNTAAVLFGAEPGFARDKPMIYPWQARDLPVTQSWVVKDC